MTLYLQVEIAKGLLVPESRLFSIINPSGENEAGHLAGDTTGKSNETLMILSQHRLFQARLIVEALQVSLGGELD